MKKFILFTTLLYFSFSVFSQTAENKYLIKYLETNTTQPDYGVTFLSDNQFIYKSPNTEKINTNSLKLSESNLFLATLGEEGDIVEKKQIQGLPTNKVTKTGASYSTDLRTVYYSAKKYRKTPKRKDKEQLFKAEVDSEGNWINVEKLPFSNNRYSFGEPSLSKSGEELYFTSDMPSSLGGLDIFMVAINDDGSFGEPINLGNKINTSGNEVTPYITEDLTLYFSSDNHKDGLGNLDIYTIDLKNPTAIAEHLDAPINSLNDDFAFIINGSDSKGYFSSNRLQGQNNYDIYSFLVEKTKEDGPCVQEITGIVKDNGTQEIIEDAIITLYDGENTEIEEFRTDADGMYSITLDCNKTYTIKAGAKNYNTEDHIVNTANYLEAPTLEANKFLIKKSAEEIENDNTLIGAIEDEETVIAVADDIKEVKNGIEEAVEEEAYEEEVETIANVIETTTSAEEDEATVEAVYFGFDKSIITPKAARELDKLGDILRNNKSIHVELSSYTDSRGNSDYNLKLSERRARASADYLVSQGIDRSRIKAKGYGESKMVNKCIDGIECSEAAHEKNRRTEIAFINPQASVENFDNNSVSDKTEILEEKAKEPIQKVVETSSYIETKKIEPSIEESDEIEEVIEPENEIVTSTLVNSLAENDKPIITEKVKENFVAKASTIEYKKKEEVLVSESLTNNVTTTEEKENKTITLNESKPEEETLSEEAKWLNKEIEKSNEDYGKIEAEKTEKEKPQLIEPITKVNQKTSVKKEPIDEEINKLVATAKAEEKVAEKFNFEREDAQTKSTISTTDPNQLLADLKAKRESKENDIDESEVKQIEKKVTAVIEPTIKKEVVLNASEVSVKAMQSKRGKYVETYNAKKINALRVIFRIQPNTNAIKGYKDAYVVIKSPQGKVVNEKGVFTLKGGDDQPYTDLTTIYYNKQSIKAVMFIDKIVHKFTKGTYTVNIFIDGVDVGENVLTLS
ncbi:OmpA family protein [Aureibaculum luteum]|uniref:OmpA family protein n=1 Tax=Aureibaculum luteum TaxID=1548456 RepID=UPI000E4BE3AE|nr:OmpA family protein [Aureibaculum luteum]